MTCVGPVIDVSVSVSSYDICMVERALFSLCSPPPVLLTFFMAAMFLDLLRRENWWRLSI